MSERQDLCSGHEKCSMADQGAAVHLPPATRPGFNLVHVTGVAAGLLVAGLLALWYFLPAPATAHAPALARKAPTAMLRFAGSNTIGSELLPALAEAYMKHQGITDIRRVRRSTAGEISLVDGKKPLPETTIEIASHGSGTAFKGLSANSVDIGVSSRKIKRAEASKLAMLGDMTAPSREHVIALDGIAVIVHRKNTVTTLTREQIAAIFSGVITDWAELKRSPGRINLYARNSESGTYDTFKSVVLDNLNLSHEAGLFEDSEKLSDKVATDPDGIGFVGLPFVKDARALAVSDGATTPLLPTRLTIATEDYPLSRRLYLYTAGKTDNPHIRKFAEFVQSKAGQEIVRQYGFMELNIQTSKVAAQKDAPEEYAQLTAAAQRLSLNFRFMPGSHRLDNKGLRDMGRVVEYIESANAANKRVMLFGFSDSVGDEALNLRLSRDRARAVGDQLSRHGVKLAQVSGYGSSLPVASNLDRDGRERNRRVEIWVKN